MHCLVKDGICARRIVVSDEPIQVFAGFQAQRGGLVDENAMDRFCNDLEQPLSAAVGRSVQVQTIGEPLASHNWCWACAEMQRSAICLFEISDGNPHIALLIGTAIAFGKRCIFLKKRNAKDRMIMDVNKAKVFIYDYLEKPTFKDALVDFSALEITSNYWKPNHPPLISRARFVRYLREKQSLITKHVLSSDEIRLAHKSRSDIIDKDFEQYGDCESRAGTIAQIQLEKETKLRLKKNDHYFSGLIADIDLKVSEGTRQGLPVSDGNYDYLVVKGVKLRIPDDQGFNYSSLTRNFPIPDNLLDLLETGEPLLPPRIAQELAIF